MYTLACADLGVAECPYVAEGATAEEAVRNMMEHGAEAHPEKMKEMEGMSEEEVMDMMKAKVKETDEVAGDMAS